jgi:hypothetical protein
MKKSIIRTLKANPVQWVALIILLFGCLQTFAQTDVSQ